jgi:hypothetical protein
MLRVSLMIVVLALAFVSDSARAQSGGCQQWCQANRCNGGMQTGNCLSTCVAACREKMSKHK